MDFHDRWLPGVLARVRAWGVHCQAEHRDRASGVYDDAPTSDDNAAPDGNGELASHTEPR